MSAFGRKTVSKPKQDLEAQRKKNFDFYNAMSKSKMGIPEGYKPITDFMAMTTDPSKEKELLELINRGYHAKKVHGKSAITPGKHEPFSPKRYAFSGLTSSSEAPQIGSSVINKSRLY